MSDSDSSPSRAGARNPEYGKTANDYALYRAPFPEELFDRLAQRGFATEAQRVLDLGTGTGAMARGLVRRGCEVVGVDISPELLREAEVLDQEAGLTVSYQQGSAEATGLSDDQFGLVTAAVCWHWFDAPRACAEIRRVLRPGGHLAIVYFGWLMRPGSLAEATERLIWKHVGPNRWKNKARYRAKQALSALNEQVFPLDNQGIHSDALSTLAEAGFDSLESFSFDADISYTHDAWRGRIRSHADVGASQSATRIARVDAGLHSLLRARFPEEPLVVPHRVFVAIGRNP